MGDLNGDGFTDIVIADPTHSVEPFYEEGMVYIIFGDGTTTFESSYLIDNADVKIRGGCGWIIGENGGILVDDLDNDGKDDLMMVALFDNGLGGGTCGDGTGTYGSGTFVMYGRTTAEWLNYYDFTNDYSATNLDDLELLQAVSIYNSGVKLHTSKDIDGDDKDEFLSSSLKHIFVIPQESGAPDKRYHGLVDLVEETTNNGHLIWDSTTDGLGNPSDIGIGFTTGDFNGDGLADLGLSNGQFNNRFWVLYGQSNFPVSIDVNSLSSLQQIQYRIMRPNPVGLAHAASGHIFGDVSTSGKKIDDLLILSGYTVNGNSQAGRVFIVPGAELSALPQGADFFLVDDILDMSGIIIDGTDENGHFGSYMSAESDLDGDSLNDLVVGSQYLNGTFGVRSLYSSSTLISLAGQEVDALVMNEFITGDQAAGMNSNILCNRDINGDNANDCLFVGLNGITYSVFGCPSN